MTTRCPNPYYVNTTLFSLPIGAQVGWVLLLTVNWFIRTSSTPELNKIARHFPQTFSLDPGLLAARWATLKQTLGWNKRQCREAIVKHPNIANASYGHQYVLDVAIVG
jgi:hypothetical protein